MFRCKECNDTNPDSAHNKQTIARGKKNRREYIKYLGDKCKLCGYHKYDGALEFHHRDPTTKSKTFASIKYWGLAKAKEELDKCDLLCANCHREVEGLVA